MSTEDYQSVGSCTHDQCLCSCFNNSLPAGAALLPSTHNKPEIPATGFHIFSPINKGSFQDKNPSHAKNHYLKCSDQISQFIKPLPLF